MECPTHRQRRDGRSAVRRRPRLRHGRRALLLHRHGVVARFDGIHFKKFEDTAPDVAEAIAAATSPYEAMKLAKQHKQQRRSDWDDIKVQILSDICSAKVDQHADVRQALAATDSRKLIENSPWDSFWGCGAAGNGQNMAGEILMKIRAEINPSNTSLHLLQ